MEKDRKSFGRKNTQGEKRSYGDKKGFGGKKDFGDKKDFGRRSSDNKKSFGDKKPYGSDRKQFGERKPFDGERKPFDGERKSFGERKPFDREKKPFDGERKPFNRDRKPFDGDKKPFDKDRKTFNGERKSFGEKKPFDKERKPFGGERRSFSRKDSAPRFERKFNDQPKEILDNRIEIALQSLIDVEKNGKYINLAFKHNDKLDRLEKRDRAYVMRILYGVTEKSFTIDWLLQKVLKDKRIKPWLNAILKIGTYQIYFMRIEDNEAIEQAKELCKKYVSEELCGFVTAVLSKLSENKEEYNPENYMFKSTTERLAVVYSYPEWLIDMWIHDYGINTVTELLENDFPRAINLRISSKAKKELIYEELENAGIKFSEGILFNSIAVNDTVNIENLDCYRNGLVTAQGIGSMLTVNALSVEKNSTVLDTCAAPGGKTFFIAEKTLAGVESCDIHEHRVELINKGLERLGLDNVKTACRDMTESVEEYKNAFDRVLIDAPCSGLGMINSKPDIKNNSNADEIKDLAAIQAKLLDTCSEYVKAGGILVYSTCTVTKDENENNVKAFLNSHSDFELIDISDYMPELLNYQTDGKTVTILPSRHNADAFFISAMRRI